MKVAVRGGHNEQATGASALLNEVAEDRRVLRAVLKYLTQLGHEVLDCTPSACDTNTDLAYGVNKANNFGADLFLSIHFNKAYDSYSGAIGTEVCVYSQNNTAQRIVDNIAALGFINRGQKFRPGLYELRNSNMTAIIIEVCFVEATEDVAIYNRIGADRVGKVIAEGAAGQVATVTPVTPSNPVVADSLLERAKKFIGVRCKELQELLIAKGYDCGGFGADGGFGQGTLNSLLKFQKDKGLTADGLAGDMTFAKLREAATPVKATVGATGNDFVRRLQAECNAQGLSNQVVDGISGTSTLAGCPTLKLGNKGNITRLLQEKLVSLGFGTNGIDGDFGNGTLKAVKAFQRAKGLGSDGAVGKNTWRALLGI